MKIVLLTGCLPHHNYFCTEIAKSHEVVGILHPRMSRPGPLAVLGRTRRAYGLAYAGLRLGARLPARLSGWDHRAENRRAEAAFFPDAARAYASLDPGLIHEDIDVDAKAATDLIRALDPDLVINLGGAIYRAPFIAACGLMLNYHSGLSPVYNGAGTVDFAFANGHPHLCGGTLMTMSPVVDGGQILAHFLPAVAADDTPASLSMKTYAGAVVLYDGLLRHLAADSSFRAIPQSGVLFSVRGAHWSLYQTLMVRYHLRRGTTGQHARPEEVIEYWRASDDGTAREMLNRTLTRLLWGG